MNAIRFNYIHLYSNALKVCILLISRSKVFGWGGGAPESTMAVALCLLCPLERSELGTTGKHLIF